MVVTALEAQQQSRDYLKPSDSTGSGTGQERFILSCQYCDWTCLDIGVTLSRPTKITEQLVKLRKRQRTDLSEQNDGQNENTKDGSGPSPDHDDAFNNLAGFYKEQLSSGDPSNPFSSSPYSSPANLARIMNIYGGLSQNALKKSREKPQPMREAQGQDEGFVTYTADDTDEEAIIEKLRIVGWENTTTTEQRMSMPSNHDAHFADELWPVATPLRSRRGKRCRTCRQFIVRGESKISSARYKIRLLAQQHIPHLTLRPLNQTTPIPNPSFRLRLNDPTPAPQPLQPHHPTHHILTLTNPVFEPVKVTLASPSTTPGRIKSRTTILCPSFTIGPAGDIWDDALSPSGTPNPNTTHARTTSTEAGRKAALSSLVGTASSDGEPRQPEAGKIWDKTRNSTSVVLEIVPGSLDKGASIVPNSAEERESEEGKESREGDEVLEVPVFVRVEWMAEPSAAAGLGVSGGGGGGEGEGKRGRGEKEPREVAFWCVLGVGEITGG